MKQVSIVIPVYNAAQCLPRCLNSIANQTYDALEVILINDGSTDNSATLCEKYCKNDLRFHLFTQENAGPASARNAGIEKATGDYITFVDADDYLETDAIECMLLQAEETAADITICRYFSERADQTVASDYRYKERLYEGAACRKLAIDSIDIHTKTNLPPYSCVRMIKSDFLKNLHLQFDTKIYRSEDYLFWVQVHFAASRVCIIQDKPLYHYIDNATSITHRYFKGYWDMAKEIYRQLSTALPCDTVISRKLDVMLVHRSLIALNIAAKCSDASIFKSEVREIVKDPVLQTALKRLGFGYGFKMFKFYYILAKFRLTPIIIKRYQMKQMQR